MRSLLADPSRPGQRRTRQPFTPRARGCGMRQCILLWCPSLIPGWIHAHGLTDDQMMILEAVDLEAGRILHDKVHQHSRGKEGEDYGRCGRGRWPFIPGDVLSMVVESTVGPAVG